MAMDLEKLASAYKALGMEKEAAGILARLAKRFGGGYARQAAKKVAKKGVPSLMDKLKSGAKLYGGLGLTGAGLYQLQQEEEGKPGLTPSGGGGGGAAAPSGGGGAFSPEERAQFERHGLNPDRLKFYQTLGRFRQGMNLDTKLMEQAMSGQLPAGVMGGDDAGDGKEDLEAYA